MSRACLKGIREWLRADFLSPKDLLLYFAWVLLVPILVLAAGLLQLIRRVRRRDEC